MLRRLLLISDHLKTGRHFSCVSLGRALEVHARTIRRNLDFLRDECGAPYLRVAPWHPSQKLQPLPNGRIHATWQVNHLIDIQRKLLSWGEHVTVLAPTDCSLSKTNLKQG